MSKRLLYITNQVCGPGGLERVLSIKASYFVDALGYKVHIMTLNQDQKDLFYEFSKNIHYHNITAKGNPLRYFRNYRSGIKRTISSVKPDILLVCDDGLKGLLLPFFIGRPCPMVYERHVSKNIAIKKGGNSLLKKIRIKTKFKIMDYGASLYDKFVVLTQGNTNEWDIKNMIVIPNPLSFSSQTELASNLSEKKVLAVGKQSFQKGYDRLLKSWKDVVARHPDWHLDIYGTIDKSQKLDSLAVELGISSNVHFFPPKKNIGDAYAKASIYTMSSRFEGFGMVLTEAMSYGVPCVSFDCPYGPSDIIDNGEDGFVVENNNMIKFSESICELIENEELRRKMGRNAKQNVQRYSIEHIAAKWEALFSELLNNDNVS